MKTKSLLSIFTIPSLAAVSLLALSLFAAPKTHQATSATTSQTQTQKDSERYILECEREWTDAENSGDTRKVEQFIAADFVGVDTDGSLYNRAKAIADARTNSQDYSSNRLIDAKVRIYSDAAVAQGSSSWERRSGSPKKGRYVWTDTFIRRNGAWQLVASEDVIVPDPAK